MIINGILFFSVHLFTESIQKYSFCLFILYPVILLNYFVVGVSLQILWGLWDFLCSQSCHLQRGTVLFSSFTVCMSYSFSRVTALGRTSSSMLDKSVKSRHLALLTILGQSIQFFTINCVVWGVGFFVGIHYQVKEVPLFS